MMPNSDGEKIVVDPIAVLTSRLGIVAREHAAALLGRQEVQWLLDHLRRMHPAVIKGVVPELAGLGLVQRVLQHLVRERVSVRDLVAILETIAEEAEHTKDAVMIGEAARARLAPWICSALANAAGVIRAIALSTALENSLNATITATERGLLFALEPGVAAELARTIQSALLASECAVIVCAPGLRVPLARFFEACGVRASVLSLAEVAPGFAIEVAMAVREPDPS
jgi:flagellar biosynthesis protein FlhA